MLSYEPDQDPTTPGIIYSADNLVPTLKGGMRQGFVTTVTALNSNLGTLGIGCHFAQLPSGSYRVFAAGVNQTLKEYSGAAWIDVSRAGGGYPAGAQWVFDQYGESTLAFVSDANVSISLDYPQISTTSGAFSNLGGAPKARIGTVSGNALLLFNLNRGGASIPDGWHRSDTGDLTNWIPEGDGGVGESEYGRLTESPGPIVASIRRGSEVVVFKRRGMWRGIYVGLPEVMRWEFLGSQYGAIGAKAVINVEDVIYFASADDIYRYDGSRPQSITMRPDGMPRINSIWAPLVRADAGSTTPGGRLFCWGHDDEAGVLYLMHTFGGENGNQTGYLAYNYATDKWGVGRDNTTRSGSTGGGINIGCFFNAPGDLVRAFMLANGDATDFPNNATYNAKGACLCLGHTSAGTGFKFFRDGFATGSGSTITWQMPWIADSAKKGGQVNRIYPVFVPGKEFQATDTLSATITAIRNRGGGATQSSKAGTLSNGQIDVIASGSMFKVDYTATPAAVTSSGFELLGHELEFAAPAPRA